jgi:hypothetical protein
MMGRPGQKCMTSEIHCSAVSRCVPHWADRTHLLLDVVERVGRVDGEADEDDVRVGVAERAQAVVVLLAGRVPQRKLDVLAVDLDVRNVVLKHSRDIDLTGGRVISCQPRPLYSDCALTSGNVPLLKTINRQVCVRRGCPSASRVHDDGARPKHAPFHTRRRRR